MEKLKKIKISKHKKTKAEKILVIGSCGSGIESRLLNHNPKQINRFVIYQSIEEMQRAGDDFYNYNCIIIFSALLISKKYDMDYYKDFLLYRVVCKDNSLCPLAAYIPLVLGLNKVIVFERGIDGYSVYKEEKLKSKFLSQVEESVQIKAKETSTGKIVDINPNINDAYWDTLMRNKFKTGELVLLAGKLPNKWEYRKYTDI